MEININEEGIKIQKQYSAIPEDEKVKKEKKQKKMKLICSVLDSSVFGALLVAYVVLSLVMKDWKAPSGLNAWSVFWTILILGAVPSSMVRTFTKKRFSEFPIWAFCTFAYLFLGMYGNLWHPYWIILLGIPAYYCIFSPIDKIIIAKEKGEI